MVDDITVYFFVESSFGFADPWLLAFCIGLGERMLVYDLSLDETDSIKDPCFMRDYIIRYCSIDLFPGCGRRL